MAFYLIGCWLFGLIWIAVLSEVSKAESLRVVAVARGLFLAGVAIMLTVTAVIVASVNNNPTAVPSARGLWEFVLGSAIPVTLLALLAARRAFAHRVALALAMLPVVVLLTLEADAFRPFGARLGGIAETAHAHHLLVVAALIACVVPLAAVAAIPRRETQ